VKSKKKAEQTVKILDEKLFQLQLIRRKLLDLQKAILPQEGESHPNPSIQN
jgi:hypothetical protein